MAPAARAVRPFGGRDDLKNGILRAVGDPDARFREDALRILRAVRFAAQLGFTVEPRTAAAMRRQTGRLECIAAERVRAELTDTLCGRFAQRALMGFSDIFAAAALPELRPMLGCAQQNPAPSVRCVGAQRPARSGRCRQNLCCAGPCCCTTAASPPAKPWMQMASAILRPLQGQP